MSNFPTTLRRAALSHRSLSIAVVAVAVLTAAVAALLLGVIGALANHPTYTATADCTGNWTAESTYSGGSNRLLELISGVVVNGQPYDLSWSNSGPNPPPDTTGDGGSPVGTNGVVTYNSYSDSKPAAIGNPAQNFLWVGVSAPGWTVFFRTGNPVLSGPSNWSGTVTQYQWNGSSWVEGGGSPTQVSVTEPPAATGCPTPTPTAPPPPPTPTPEPPTPTPTQEPATQTPVGQTPSPTPIDQTPTPTPVGQTPSPTPVGQTPTPTPVGQTPSPTPVGQTPSPTPVGQTPSPTATPVHTTTPAPTTPAPTPSPTPSPTVCCASQTPPPTGPVGGFVDVVTAGGGGGDSSMLVMLGLLLGVAGAVLAVGGYRKAAGR